MSPWKRTFVSAFIAQIFSIVGFAFAFPFLPFFIRELGIEDRAQQAWWAGVVQSAAGLTLAVFAPIWGILADKYGRKLMVVRAMIAGTAIMFLMSMVQTVQQLVICRLLQGAFTGTVSASVALVASVTPSRRSGFALGMMQAAVMIGVCLGPLAGGIIADQFGYRQAFRIGAVIIFIGGIFILFGTKEEFVPPTTEEKATGLGLRALTTAPGFLAAVLVLFSIRLSNSIAMPAFPLIVKDILGTEQKLNSVTGSIIAAASLSGAVSAAVLGHFGDRWGHRTVLMLCALGAAIVSAMTAFAHSIPCLFAVRIVFGFAVAGMMPAANAIILGVTQGKDIGKAYGIATSLSMGGFALGPFIGGALARTFGVRLPFLVTGACQMLVAAIVFAAIPRAGEKRTVQETPNSPRTRYRY